MVCWFFFFSSRRRHTRFSRDWSSDVCSSDLVAAAQRLAAIQTIKNQMEVWSAQRDLLREVNPILVTAGFEEILKFHLGDETLVTPLLTHLDGPRPEFRIQACKVLGQMFGKGR